MVIHVSSFWLQSACVKNHCKNNATCQSGFTEKGFRCLCTAGFKGQNCDQGKPQYNWLIKTNRTIQSRVKKKKNRLSADADSTCGVYPLSGSHPETLHEKANSRPCLLFPEIKSIFVKQKKAMLDDYLFDRMMKNIEYVIDN